jgi:hypothetical protein
VPKGPGSGYMRPVTYGKGRAYSGSILIDLQRYPGTRQ